MATAMKAVQKNTASTEDLAAQVETLRADLSKLTETMTAMGKNAKDSAIHAASDKAAQLRDSAADKAETARLQAMELQGQANDFVKNQPATALGIAAGVGFLVGFLTMRK
ncbi:DUF883 family protein [Alphaproteobacteria bacterium KMM 3653]|uniref:DUF883 family protein n=1 Tax=Harenicola maris TaxID=2841044 RepID=A0AAP2G2N1_9RHOB|nr:DUF883 family protein [Harenicola maris]